MRLFRCSCPARPVLHFENVACGSCGRLTGFSSETLALQPFEPAGDAWLDDDGRAHRLCDNRTRHATCNWMVRLDPAAPGATADAAGPSPLCVACRLNRVIPDLSVAGNLELWRALEQAKRRCLFSFLELGLPFAGEPPSESAPAFPALGFRFMADAGAADGGASASAAEPVLTGHEDGIVTINLAEADAIARTRMQLAMHERYRTLLGHFRHETGHYYWDWLARGGTGFAEAFRERFGDERADYAAALAAHYARGAPADWSRTHISAYATVHPWEDWAESWAHYLHIVDTLETQQSFGVETRLVTAGVGELRLPFALGAGTDAERLDFDAIVALWVEVSVMLNSLNRSMGLPDPYPFVLSPAAIEKLRFVHEALLGASGRARRRPEAPSGGR